MNKIEFVKANPILTTAELIAKAESEGIKLTKGYLYKIRSEAKGKKKKVAKKAKVAPVVTKAATQTGSAHVASVSSADDILVAVAAHIGLPRALEVLIGQQAIAARAIQA